MSGGVSDWYWPGRTVPEASFMGTLISRNACFVAMSVASLMSETPGSWRRILSAPSDSMTGSLTPRELIRRSMTVRVWVLRSSIEVDVPPGMRSGCSCRMSCVPPWRSSPRWVLISVLVEKPPSRKQIPGHSNGKETWCFGMSIHTARTAMTTMSQAHARFI